MVLTGVIRGSKRNALILVPGIALPGLLSFAALASVGRISGGVTLGELSLAWVTATFGSAVVAMGPSQVALRAVGTGEAEDVPSLRALALKRSAWVLPIVAAAGGILVAAGRPVGIAILLAVPWVLTQAFCLFEIEMAKAEGRFAKSSAIAVGRSAAGWTATVIGANVGGTLAWCIVPHVATSAVILLALRPQFERPTERSMIRNRDMGRDIGRLSIASYSLGYADRYVVNALLGPVAVGIYTLGYQLGEGALELVSSPVSNALLPRLVSEWSDEERGPAVAFATAQRAAVVILAISVASVPCVFVAKALGLFELISTSADLPVVTAIIAVAVGVQGVTRLAYGLLLARGRPDLATRSFWRAVGVSAVVVPLFTSAWGVVGAALATLVGYAVLAGMMMHAAKQGEPQCG